MAMTPVGACYLADWFQVTAQIGTKFLTAQGYWDTFVARVTPPAWSLQFTTSSLSISKGTLRMRLNGAPGTVVVVDTSPDLKTWTPWQTNALPVGGLDLAAPAGTENRFLRARQQ